ncbi:MAG: aldo/keto reductase [Oscillospiraceae bacterium]|nr:aldo/keto reductase [Oscillospiraceae bacterium]
MQYRSDKYGNPLSILGFGCMRFQQKLGKIDFAEAEREIMEAYRSGVNYFDTAYIYPGSEALIGEIFEKNGIRQQVKIATKLPHYLIKSAAAMDKLFAEELRRLRTDYVDYYLMHMLNDVDTWQRLRELGIEDWLKEKKESGAIRQVGFSYHGNTEAFCKLVDAYDWDFCQIQYNYLDEHSQAGRKGLQYAHAKGLPVIIMEPLRGGKLVNLLPEEAKRIIADFTPKRSPADWAFRWLWDQPEVTVVLSGMNTVEMVRENVQTASAVAVGEMDEAQQQMLRQVVSAINAKMKVGCTGCGYCMPCPRGVDIPGTFAALNRYHTESKFAGLKEYVMCTTLRTNSATASNCIGCGKCEKHCPQGIEIRKMLKVAQKDLENTVYHVGSRVMKWFTHF